MLRRLLGSAAAAVDRAATYAASRGAPRRSAGERLSHADRVRHLEAIAAGWAAHPPEAFFGPPGPVFPERRPVGRWPGRPGVPEGSIEDLTWPSEHGLLLPELAGRYDRTPTNATAAARLFRRGSGRPVAVLIHGYLGGNYALEQRFFPVGHLDRLGLDVALFCLPFHGVRADPRRRGSPPFPASDPRRTVEGFRQAVGDLRALRGALLGAGHAGVGLMGMSLGGYTAALAATVEAGLSFVVPMIPLASLADFARDHGRLGQSPEETNAQHALLEAAHAPVSPVHRTPLVPGERMLVIAAESDRITPPNHARRIAAHFGARLIVLPGGHLLQLGRRAVFRELGGFLLRLGVV